MEALPTQDEINFYRLFSISSAVGEFIYDNKYYPHFIPSTEYKPFRFWEKQLNIINSESRRVGVTGAKNVGKALALDTPIATPTGWTTMGEIRVGDKVFDEEGRPTTVTFVTPVMLNHKCFEVVFSDGSIITADADHQWFVRSCRTEKKWGVLTTDQIRRDIEDEPLLSYLVPDIAMPELQGRLSIQQPPDLRYIAVIRSVSSVPVRCIQVDSPNHLYLAGKTLIPTHNTIMGVAKLIQKCLQIKGTPTEYKTVLVASARTDTMRPLFQDIVDIWRNHWILTHFLERESSNQGVNKNDRIIRIKSPYYIEINGRIPGGEGADGTGFQMIHPPGDSLAWPDEASYISGEQLDNWMRVVAPETEQYVSGIPKVTLLGSMLHKLQTEPAYRFTFFPLGIVDNPDYTQEQIEQLIEEYGGRQSTRARLVLFGEWVEGLGNFWLDLKLCKKYDDKSFYPFDVARALESSRYNKELLGGALRLPPPPKDTQDIVAGIDYGASVHPTVISIFFNRNDIWYPWGRIQLEKFKPDQQAEVLDWLDDRFNFTTLGIDTFQGGGGVFNFMINKTLYPDKNYEDRLVYIAATQGIPIEVRTETDAEYQARVGLNRNLKPNDTSRQQVAEKQRVIPYSMNKIRYMLYGGELFIPEEPELKEEFAGFTEELKTQPQGRSFIEFSSAEKDQDHIVQSWQMFVATLALRKPPKFDKDHFELFLDWYSDGTENKVGMVEPGIRKIGSMPGMSMVG